MKDVDLLIEASRNLGNYCDRKECEESSCVLKPLCDMFPTSLPVAMKLLANKEIQKQHI